MTSLPDNRDYTAGSNSFNGYKTKKATFEDCKALCKSTPKCVAVAYCDKGSGSRTGECWGTTGVAADKTPSGGRRSGCASSKNAYFDATGQP